jgi:uncharacterized surface protein with fasciclin (FAS1) repeats
MTWSEPFTTKADKKEVGESKSYGATVIFTDILASNGVIHIIDAVLNPDDAE